MKEVEEYEEKEICGTCQFHNTYDYPLEIFCFAKLGKKEKAVRSVFDPACNDYRRKTQDCYCLRDALKAIKRKDKKS